MKINKILTLFTPYSQLLSAINENQESSTNFSDFVNRDTFITMYPKKSVKHRKSIM